MLNKNQVEKLSILSKIPLKEGELNVFKSQIPKIISFVEKLNQVDAKNLEATYQVTGKKNEFREDIAGSSLSQKEALKNAPNKKSGYILTEKVFDAK